MYPSLVVGYDYSLEKYLDEEVIAGRQSSDDVEPINCVISDIDCNGSGYFSSWANSEGEHAALQYPEAQPFVDDVPLHIRAARGTCRLSGLEQL
jgi:hypothetical protein